MTKRRTRADLLKELRKRLGGVSQEKLAGRVGVSWSTVNRWESGKGTPSPLAREKLISLLNEAGLGNRVEDLDLSA